MSAQTPPSDAEKLEEELKWVDGSRFTLGLFNTREARRTPPGVHALTALNIICSLPLWVLAFKFLPATGATGLASIAILIVALLVGFVAGRWVAERAWRAMGSMPRRVFRVVGYLGPSATLILLVGCGVGVYALFRAPLPPEKTEGPGWKLLPGPTAADGAKARCDALGGGFRLPRDEEGDRLGQALGKPRMSVDHIHLVGADGSSMMLRYDQRDGLRRKLPRQVDT